MATSSETCPYRESIDVEIAPTHGAANGTEAVRAETELTDPDVNESNSTDIQKPRSAPQSPSSTGNRASTLFPLEEIPEPIKVLDDIISEFEDASKPVVLGNGENQSEDDGYMSLSRKNMHRMSGGENPETDVDNGSGGATASASASTAATPNQSFSEYFTSFIANGESVSGAVDTTAPRSPRSAIPSIVPIIVSTAAAAEPALIQSTLPKVRPNSASSTNYSSLPCCGLRSTGIESRTRGGSCNGERNALGIDISAVHNAVLRGGLAKLPERIVNEHPVTIYPGPGRSHRPQRLSTSVEKHKELCHILNPLTSSLSSSTSSSSSASRNSDEKKTPTISPTAKCAPQQPASKYRRPATEYDFSDDSLEYQRSLTPPPPAPAAPAELALPPVAWEINFETSGKRKSKPKPKSARLRAPFDRSRYSTKTDLGAMRYARDKHSRESALQRHADPDNSIYSSEEQLNAPIYRQGGNMLGKGTFIIRRAAKKEVPKALDIFKGAAGKAKGQAKATTSSESDENNYRGYVNAEAGKAHAKSRRSLELEKPAAPALTSPRDRERLSLVLDSHRTNSLKNEVGARAVKDKKSPEGQSFSRLTPKYNPPQNNLPKKIPPTHIHMRTAVRTTNQGLNYLNQLKFSKLRRAGSASAAFRGLDNHQGSFESPNTIKSPDDVDGMDVKIKSNSGYDACAAFAYKTNNANNGAKSQEYNELRTSNTTTPHTDLAPTLEEEEEQYSDLSYGCEPLRRIESNISALLRGDIAVVRVGEPLPTGSLPPPPPPPSGKAKRPLEFRPGVHKSESAKEMLLSQNAFGPLPPSPPSSNPDTFDYDDLPPLPPTPTELAINVDVELPKPPYMHTTSAEVHSQSSSDELRHREKLPAVRHLTDELPPPPPPTFENLAPAVPPHRIGHSTNTMKSWSIDSNYRKRSPKMLGYGSGITTPTGPQGTPTSCEPGGSGCGPGGAYATRRYVSYGTKRSLKQSPREEHRLQTSCSLPETPIFARGCDIPRTPFRRQNENSVSGSRTAPRSSTSHSINMGTSIVGIAGGSAYGTGMCRQRSINHALASNEMLRMSGAPARGWYPKQRTMRPASTENIDRLSSGRVWDSSVGMSGTGQSRKPLTLPPNLTPSFLNKSPREALRRVTSLLITKKKNTKERKNKAYSENTMESHNATYEQDTSTSAKSLTRNSTTATPNGTVQKPPKKKGLFKNLWKRTKHASIDQ